MSKAPKLKWNVDTDHWSYDDVVLKFLTQNLREMVDMNQVQIWARANQLLLFLTNGEEGQGELDPNIRERYFTEYFNKKEEWNDYPPHSE